MKTRSLCLCACVLGFVVGSVPVVVLAADPEVIFYHGAGDGSAAAALPDPRFFAAAEDEFNILRIYESHPKDPLQAKPVWSQEFSKRLGVREKDECDLEGATRIGQRIYWIGSHGFHKDDSERKAHRVLFATDIVTGHHGHPELRLVGKPYRHLLADLTEDERLKRFALAKASERWPKEREGLNVEALCATPGGDLLIGFRGPMPEGGRALLVTLPDPASWVGAGKHEAKIHAKAGDFYELDLGRDRGFRDMARWRDGYLILAGHYDKKPDFALYSWTGKGTDAPRLLTTDFHGLRPEGLVVYPDEPDRVQVLSDDGRQQPPPDGDRETKAVPVGKRRFQSIWVALPAAG